LSWLRLVQIFRYRRRHRYGLVFLYLIKWVEDCGSLLLNIFKWSLHIAAHRLLLLLLLNICSTNLLLGCLRKIWSPSVSEVRRGLGVMITCERRSDWHLLSYWRSLVD
jgi:hypothetical protein